MRIELQADCYAGVWANHADDGTGDALLKPLTAEDVAEVCVHAVELPHHVNLDQIVMRPVAQAAQHKVFREDV